MKIAVIGSRSVTQKIDFFKIIPPSTELIVSGGAHGIDSLIEDYAKKYGIPFVTVKPNYERNGASAPLIRDREIVDMVDEVFSFWDGQSNGTAFTMKYAEKVGKPVRLFLFNK